MRRYKYMTNWSVGFCSHWNIRISPLNCLLVALMVCFDLLWEFDRWAFCLCHISLKTNVTRVIKQQPICNNNKPTGKKKKPQEGTREFHKKLPMRISCFTFYYLIIFSYHTVQVFCDSFYFNDLTLNIMLLVFFLAKMLDTSHLFPSI